MVLVNTKFWDGHKESHLPICGEIMLILLTQILLLLVNVELLKTHTSTFDISLIEATPTKLIFIEAGEQIVDENESAKKSTINSLQKYERQEINTLKYDIYSTKFTIGVISNNRKLNDAFSLEFISLAETKVVLNQSVINHFPISNIANSIISQENAYKNNQFRENSKIEEEKRQYTTNNDSFSIIYRESTIREKKLLSDSPWMMIIIELLDEELDADELDEILLRLSLIAENPFEISQVNRGDLERLPFLTDYDISQILQLRVDVQKTGVLDEITLELLRYFIKFEDFSKTETKIDEKLLEKERSNFLRNYSKNRSPIFIESRFSTGFPSATGYLGDEPHYIGNRHRITDRIWFQNDRYSGHFARAKQPGEMSNYPASLGFTTGHMRYKNEGYISDILLGDFTVRFGAGLILARGAQRGGTRNMQRLGNTGGIIAPYRSASPSAFMRGGNVTIKTNSINAYIFHSKRYLSATEANPDKETYYMPGWWMSKRTQSEQNRYQNLGLQSSGIILTHSFSRNMMLFDLGFASVYHRFDSGIERRSAWHNQYDFEGNTLLQYSGFSGITYKNLKYVVEIAGASEGGKALIHAISSSWRDISIGFWNRYYSRDFHVIYGGGAGALSGGSNEIGSGAWMQLRIIRGMRLRMYADRYRSVGARYGADVGVWGWERGLAWDYRASRVVMLKVDGYVRGDGDPVAGVDGFGRSVRFLSDRERKVLRGSVRVEPGAGWGWVMRGEVRSGEVGDVDFMSGNSVESQNDITAIVQNPGKGVGITQLFKISFKRADVYFQHTLFDTDSYESRIYSYEYDMLQTIRILSFAGRGARSYIMLHAEPHQKIVMRLKLGNTQYYDRFSIGSANDTTVGSKRHDLSFQIQIRV
jgi:hypothetical protein